jgi:exodeoxyribonuclease III
MEIGMTKLATWNVNSIRVRLEQVLDWIECEQIDILAIQETKTLDKDFPQHVFHERGLHVIFSGQKTYNGVAIVSRFPIENIITAIPNYQDEQRRVCAVTINNVRIINLYVPNGSDLTSDKYQYKLDWLKHVTSWVREEMLAHTHLAVVGDFNIAPHDHDVYDPNIWKDCVLVSPPERKAFNDLLDLGLYDSFRKHNLANDLYSWWDYRAGSFRKNKGLRIDHILASKGLYEQCVESNIDIAPRCTERPSDHAPVWIRY